MVNGNPSNSNSSVQAATNVEFVLTVPSPIDSLTLVSDGQSLLAVKMVGQRFENFGLAANAQVQDGSHIPVLQEARMWLETYFEGKNPGALPRCNPSGSAFQKRVWEALSQIPYGQTITYGELAKELAKSTPTGKMSAQAVGGAVGHNPINIIIPCHRVMGASNKVTGYGGGIRRKLFLLELEGIDTSDFIMPAHDTI